MVRLLIVEDEILVGLCLQEELLDRGCSVTLEQDAEAVLANENRARIDAAIIDISLPGMKGDELARHLRSQQPALPIVLSTGHALHEIAADLRADPNILVALKPYAPGRIDQFSSGTWSDDRCPRSARRRQLTPSGETR